MESVVRAKKEYLVTWHKLRAENVNESDREQQHKQLYENTQHVRKKILRQLCVDRK